MKTKLILISALIFILVLIGFGIFLKTEKDKAAKIKKETEAKQVKTINNDFDRIFARLGGVYDESTASESKSTDYERDAEQVRVRQLENSVKVEISDIIADMKDNGFTNEDKLKNSINDYFSQIDIVVYTDRQKRNMQDEGNWDAVDDLNAQYSESIQKAGDDLMVISNREVNTPELQAYRNEVAKKNAKWAIVKNIVNLVKTGNVARAKKSVDSIQDESLKGIAQLAMEDAIATHASKIAKDILALLKADDTVGAKKIVDSIQDESLKEAVMGDVNGELGK